MRGAEGMGGQDQARGELRRANHHTRWTNIKQAYPTIGQPMERHSPAGHGAGCDAVDSERADVKVFGSGTAAIRRRGDVRCG